MPRRAKCSATFFSLRDRVCRTHHRPTKLSTRETTCPSAAELFTAAIDLGGGIKGSVYSVTFPAPWNRQSPLLPLMIVSAQMVAYQGDSAPAALQQRRSSTS